MLSLHFLFNRICTINNKERPNYLSIGNNSSGSLDELPKPRFTHSAKGKLF
jgi:hypothetical protein